MGLAVERDTCEQGRRADCSWLAAPTATTAPLSLCPPPVPSPPSMACWPQLLSEPAADAACWTHQPGQPHRAHSDSSFELAPWSVTLSTLVAHCTLQNRACFRFPASNLQALTWEARRCQQQAGVSPRAGRTVLFPEANTPSDVDDTEPRKGRESSNNLIPIATRQWSAAGTASPHL